MSRVEKLLTQANECLPDDIRINSEITVATTGDFNEFMKHHEWELAMETLEEIATNMKPAAPAAFWSLLIQAARIMKSYSNLSRYESYIN